MSERDAMRLLLSEPCRQRLASRIRDVPGAHALHLVAPEEGDADIAFVSRDVTGLSTKHETLPPTQRFYDALARSPRLRWVHVHSAGADRPIYQQLLARGVVLTTSPGANAHVVAQSVLAAVLSLARRFPLLREAQARRHWQPLIQTGLPPELEGQRATVVGWGPVGQHVARYLDVFGLRTTVVRHRATQEDCDRPVATYGTIDTVLPATDWLILACPLSEQTQGLISAQRMALLPPGAHVINVARGAVLDEHALVEALRARRLAGAYLDVFAREPLPADSPLWDLPNTLVTPHSAGFSDGNEARVDALFLQHLGDRLADRA